MKTSTKLFSAAIVIIILSMVLVNLELKAKYLTMKKQGIEEYRKTNRFNEFKKAQVTHFDNIDIKSANSQTVNIEYGEKAAVWIHENSKDMIEVTQKGNTLFINLNKKGLTDHAYGEVVVISPHIKTIKTAGFNYPGSYRAIQTFIEGFSQDSMSITTGALASIVLNKNKFKSLKAVVGDNLGNSGLVIESDNDIVALKLEVKGKSVVDVQDSEIEHIEHRIDKDATVTFRGSAIPKL